jgi:two-component system cell cycle sensor histidine kinase/response regulator CckA
MSDAPQRELIRQLEERIHLLTRENEELTERAEETLLLGLIAEKLGLAGDADQVITQGLEQVGLLKNIPCAACYLVDGRHVRLLHSYLLASDEPLPARTVVLEPDSPVPWAAGLCRLQGDELAAFPLLEAEEFPATSITLLPVKDRRERTLLFLFAADSGDEQLSRLDLLLTRVVDMMAARLDILSLLAELQYINEMLDQKVAQRTAELSASREEARAYFEFAFDAVHIVDSEFRIVDANRRAIETSGYSREEYLSLTVLDLNPDLDAKTQAAVAERIQREKRVAYETRHRMKDGTLVPVEVCINLLDLDGRELYMTQIRDLTERDQLRHQLAQSQKMEAVGRLAGGIAHDFNNILTAIMGHVDILRMDLGDDRAAMEGLENMMESSRRAAHLTQQLLAFSRKQVMELKPVDLAEAVESTLRMLRRTIAENIRLETDLDPDSGQVFGDTGKLEQIIMNLVLNARDAVDGGGTVTVRTRRIEPEETFLPPIASGPEGTGMYLLLQVMDTGTGIPEDNLDKVFDPFFTTKEVGKGTGLGLAMVYGLARQHNAVARVRNRSQGGALFEIIFPELKRGGAQPQAVEKPVMREGEGTILLVEDDPGIREVLAQMLMRLGYQVVRADHGRHALDVSARHAGRIDLVLTDLIMPGMGGVELVHNLRLENPGLKVLYMSGYPDVELKREDLEAEGSRFLQKPISFSRLSAELGALLR